LSGNQLKVINFTDFEGLDVLWLDGNSLTTFNASEFGLTSCYELLLHDNKIADFNLAEIENFRKLSLMNNNLTVLKAAQLPRNSALLQVSFRNNQIKAIEKKFIGMIKELDVTAYANNPCVKMEKANKVPVMKLDQCFKTYEKEIAIRRLVILD
jgi:Leucine-rich repeat (LRR) protein